MVHEIHVINIRNMFITFPRRSRGKISTPSTLSQMVPVRQRCGHFRSDFVSRRIEILVPKQKQKKKKRHLPMKDKLSLSLKDFNQTPPPTC